MRESGSLSKSAGPNKRLYYLRYSRLLISPRNPNVFFLTICTLPSSCGSCAGPRYPENKQVVRVYSRKSDIFAAAGIYFLALRSEDFNRSYTRVRAEKRIYSCRTMILYYGLNGFCASNIHKFVWKICLSRHVFLANPHFRIGRLCGTAKICGIW